MILRLFLGYRGLSGLLPSSPWWWCGYRNGDKWNIGHFSIILHMSSAYFFIIKQLRLVVLSRHSPFGKLSLIIRIITRAVLSPGNRAKPCKFRYVKPVRIEELHTKDLASERENSHFRRPHSPLTSPHQRTPTECIIALQDHPKSSALVGPTNRKRAYSEQW